MSNECEHQWRWIGSHGSNVIFACIDCKLRIERPATELEREIINSDNDVGGLNVHSVWHEFCAEFSDKRGDGWRLSGYDFMEAIEEYAKTHPDIKVIGCDDLMHMSSDIVLIPHKSDGSYWGTTVLYIAQCGGEPPVCFFLYPSHNTDLITALLGLEAEARVRNTVHEAQKRLRGKQLTELIECTPPVAPTNLD